MMLKKWFFNKLFDQYCVDKAAWLMGSKKTWLQKLCDWALNKQVKEPEKTLSISAKEFNEYCQRENDNRLKLEKAENEKYADYPDFDVMYEKVATGEISKEQFHQYLRIHPESSNKEKYLQIVRILNSKLIHCEQCNTTKLISK